MSNFDSDGGAEHDWDDRGDLAWNEFDWERYLRDQDEAVRRYLRFYAECKDSPDRIDAVAEKMEWDQGAWSDEEPEAGGSSGDDGTGKPGFDDASEVYTLHKNPIFVSTKAIYLGLAGSWHALAIDGAKVPQALAVNLMAALGRGEDIAVQAIHALDFGDYAMAISLFKRALSVLNESLALLSGDQAAGCAHVRQWREHALPALFDLREIWLRVIAECRDELERPLEDDI